MSDSDSESDTGEPRGCFTLSRGRPIKITSTNTNMWIVLGPKREFEVQYLRAGETVTITPNQGKVGVVRHREERKNGKWVFTVDLYTVKKPKEGDKLEAKGEVKQVEKVLGVSTKHIKPSFSTNYSRALSSGLIFRSP